MVKNTSGEVGESSEVIPGERSLVARRLLACGKRRGLKSGDAAGVLRELLDDEQKSLDEIAGMLKVTRQAVAYHAKRYGIETLKPGRPLTMLGRVRKFGHEDIEDYFRKHPTKTFEAMADELSVSTSTVQRHYEHFIQHVRRGA